MLDYWEELRSWFPVQPLLDNWDALFALNYLDFERASIAPGSFFRESGAPIESLCDLSLRSFVEDFAPADTEALKGAIGIDNAISGQIPRGRHRATFCMAMESVLSEPNQLTALIQELGIPEKPKKWQKLTLPVIEKIASILDEYKKADKKTAGQILNLNISPEKALSEIDLAEEAEELKQIHLPVTIDFNSAKVNFPIVPPAEIKSAAGNGKAKKKIDYKKKATQSALIGNVGEEYVLQYERHRLAKFPELVKKIEWVSQADDTLGYDIKSFEENGEPRYIEVKSTTGAANTDFYMSMYEVKKAEELGPAYRIYRVFNLGKDAIQFFEITNPLNDFVVLTTETYRVGIKPVKN